METYGEPIFKIVLAMPIICNFVYALLVTVLFSNDPQKNILVTGIAAFLCKLLHFELSLRWNWWWIHKGSFVWPIRMKCFTKFAVSTI